jgi:hypothetical protein
MIACPAPATPTRPRCAAWGRYSTLVAAPRRFGALGSAQRRHPETSGTFGGCGRFLGYRSAASTRVKQSGRKTRVFPSCCTFPRCSTQVVMVRPPPRRFVRREREVWMAKVSLHILSISTHPLPWSGSTLPQAAWSRASGGKAGIAGCGARRGKLLHLPGNLARGRCKRSVEQ